MIELENVDKTYDLVLDNYCLQSIVTDSDRQKLLSVIGSLLKESGYYIIATAMYNNSRHYGDDCFYSSLTGVVYDKIDDPENYPDAKFINDHWWIPYRRHLKADALREELMKSGFIILFQEDGNLICKKG